MLYVILTLLLLGLSFLAGMMGLGVAFIATPVLGLFGFELKHEIKPLSLWLNGITTIAGAVAFARKRMVDWRTAIPLLVITTPPRQQRGKTRAKQLHQRKSRPSGVLCGKNRPNCALGAGSSESGASRKMPPGVPCAMSGA